MCCAESASVNSHFVRYPRATFPHSAPGPLAFTGRVAAGTQVSFVGSPRFEGALWVD